MELFILYFFLRIAIVQRQIEINSLFSSTIFISQTIVVLPLCMGVAIAFTIPSFFTRKWLALISIPTGTSFSRLIFNSALLGLLHLFEIVRLKFLKPHGLYLKNPICFAPFSLLSFHGARPLSCTICGTVCGMKRVKKHTIMHRMLVSFLIYLYYIQ